MKKRILNLLIALIASVSAYAQAPNSFKYQAVVRDASSNLIANQNVSFRLSIFKTSTTGLVVYSETHSVTTNNHGLANMNVGTGTLVSGNFATIDWGTDLYFIKTELDATGGSAFSDMGTSQLQSVPYALNAKSVSGMVLDDLTDVNTSAATTNQLLGWNGSNWVPTTQTGGTTYNAGTGISLSGTTFSNSAPDQTVSLTQAGATTITGTYPNFTISSADNNTTYAAGTGLSLSGTTFSAQNSSALWNANSLQGRTVSSTAPSTNQVLGWNGSQWAPQTASTGSSPWTTSGSDIYRNSGNIGIGTTTPSPTRKLIVIGTVGTGIQAESSGNFTVCNAVAGFATTSNTTGENQGIYGEATNSSTANVGGIFIATGSTGSTNYGIFASGNNATTNYAGYFNGNVSYTGTLTNVSDRRLKTNITPYAGALNKLMQLEIYRYNYSATGGYSNLVLAQEKQYGFLAQDLEKLFPDLVHDNKVPNKKTVKEDGTFDVIEGGAEYKSVNQIGMIPILTKAIQEQQELITNQQLLIERQNQLIENLDKRIIELEK